jgi:hypothetical protein
MSSGSGRFERLVRRRLDPVIGGLDAADRDPARRHGFGHDTLQRDAEQRIVEAGLALLQNVKGRIAIGPIATQACFEQIEETVEADRGMSIGPKS